MWLRNPSTTGSRLATERASVISVVASVRPGRNGTKMSRPASAAARSIAAAPPRTIRSAIEIFIPSLRESLNDPRTFSSFDSTPASFSGRLDFQSFMGANRIRAPSVPPRLSLSRNDDADAHAVDTRSLTDTPLSSSCFFNAAISGSPTSLWSTAGVGSCQICGSGTSGPSSLACGPMSRWVSLYHALANASRKASGSSWNLREIFS